MFVQVSTIIQRSIEVDISISEFLEKANRFSLNDEDHSDHEFLGSGNDSCVYRVDSKVVKFYIEKDMQALGREKAGEVLMLYKDVTKRALDYFKDKFASDGERQIPIEITPIEDLFWFSDCTCWVSISPYVSGWKIIGKSSMLVWSIRSIELGLAEMDYELRTHFRVNIISIRKDNFKLIKNDSREVTRVIVTDLAYNIAYLKEVEDYPEYEREFLASFGLSSDE